jgi:glycosyltransferase involved in cell wall biosynthesis
VKIVAVHNFYQQPGGEDQVFADETALLESHGHWVVRHTVHNDDVDGLTRLTLARRTIWNKPAGADLAEVVRREKADVVHVHNTFPLMSMAVLSAARGAGAAVVQTLHNYRPVCPSAVLYRDGHICQDCLKKTVPWPAVVHRCYRGDRSASAVAASMLAYHHVRKTFHREVDRFIALTEFARGKFVEAGMPGDRIVVKPNFVCPDPGPGTGAGGYALFVGRLTETKGVAVLLDAWTKLRRPIPLKIVGDGDLRDRVTAAASGPIEYLGRRSPTDVAHLMANAAVLIFPSVWYEGLPKTILESFAAGTPVIASDLGSMAELVTPGRQGQRFAAGDPGALAAVVNQLFEHPSELAGMRSSTRAEFERAYTAAENYRRLIEIYKQAMAHRGAHLPDAGWQPAPRPSAESAAFPPPGQ